MTARRPLRHRLGDAAAVAAFLVSVTVAFAFVAVVLWQATA